MSDIQALIDRFKHAQHGWLPGGGDVINITLTLSGRDEIVRLNSECEASMAEIGALRADIEKSQREASRAGFWRHRDERGRLIR